MQKEKLELIDELKEKIKNINSTIEKLNELDCSELKIIINQIDFNKQIDMTAVLGKIRYVGIRIEETIVY